MLEKLLSMIPVMPWNRISKEDEHGAHYRFHQFTSVGVHYTQKQILDLAVSAGLQLETDRSKSRFLSGQVMQWEPGKSLYIVELATPYGIRYQVHKNQ